MSNVYVISFVLSFARNEFLIKVNKIICVESLDVRPRTITINN